MRALAAAVLLGWCGVAHATSGFVREPGGGYVKLYYSELRSSVYFTLDGVRRDDGQQLRQRGVTLYGEYGLLPHVQIAVSLPLLRANSFTASDASAGLGDASLELKSGTAIADWHLAAALALELPTGRSRAFVDLDDGGQINLPTGDGEWNLWARVALSRGLPSLRAYASLDVGYNLRTEGFTDQYGAGFEVGHQLLGYVWLSARARVQKTLGDDINAGVPFLYGEGSEFVAIDAGAAVPVFSSAFVTLDYTNVAAARRNVYGGSLVSVGMGATW
ncbi:MAG: hypothetical protein ACAI38_19290 [Myxococcota bacterium]|nr:hypothetical protein [Myxococcota bacterium]